MHRKCSDISGLDLDQRWNRTLSKKKVHENGRDFQKVSSVLQYYNTDAEKVK